MGWLLLREIMTTVHFAKRCKSDRKVIDERNRPLTDEGVSASYKVMEILKDKKIKRRWNYPSSQYYSHYMD